MCTLYTEIPDMLFRDVIAIHDHDPFSNWEVRVKFNRWLKVIGFSPSSLSLSFPLSAFCDLKWNIKRPWLGLLSSFQSSSRWKDWQPTLTLAPGWQPAESSLICLTLRDAQVIIVDERTRSKKKKRREKQDCRSLRGYCPHQFASITNKQTQRKGGKRAVCVINIRPILRMCFSFRQEKKRAVR